LTALLLLYGNPTVLLGYYYDVEREQIAVLFQFFKNITIRT